LEPLIIFVHSRTNHNLFTAFQRDITAVQLRTGDLSTPSVVGGTSVRWPTVIDTFGGRPAVGGLMVVDRTCAEEGRNENVDDHRYCGDEREARRVENFELDNTRARGRFSLNNARRSEIVNERRG